MKFLYLSFMAFLFLILISCQKKENYYPAHSPDLNTALYQKYKLKLDTAYMQNDFFMAGLQLANLKAPPEKVFEYINQGIATDNDACYQMYDWYEIYDDFKPNIVKSDTTRFLNSFQLCLEKMGPNSYEDFIEKKHADHRAKMASRVKLDTTLFNTELISQLTQIIHDDQELRSKYDFDKLSKDEKDEIWVEIDKVDSINLIKVESILKKYGYPTKEMVGYELVTAPWYVLHHQSDLTVRDKYESMIAENLGGGLLKTYRWRSDLLRLKTEKDQLNKTNKP